MNIESIDKLKKEKNKLALASELLSKENYGKLMESKGKTSMLIPFCVLVDLAISSLLLNGLFFNYLSYLKSYLGSILYNTPLPVMFNIEFWAIIFTFVISASVPVAYFFITRGPGKYWVKYKTWYKKEDSTIEELNEIFEN